MLLKTIMHRCVMDGARWLSTSLSPFGKVHLFVSTSNFPISLHSSSPTSIKRNHLCYHLSFYGYWLVSSQTSNLYRICKSVVTSIRAMYRVQDTNFIERRAQITILSLRKSKQGELYYTKMRWHIQTSTTKNLVSLSIYQENCKAMDEFSESQ